MKASAILLALIATGTILLGAANAAGESHEEAAAIPLLDGGALYIACKNGATSLTHCDQATLWQEANGFAGLQKAAYGRYTKGDFNPVP